MSWSNEISPVPATCNSQVPRNVCRHLDNHELESDKRKDGAGADRARVVFPIMLARRPHLSAFFETRLLQQSHERASQANPFTVALAVDEVSSGPCASSGLQETISTLDRLSPVAHAQLLKARQRQKEMSAQL